MWRDAVQMLGIEDLCKSPYQNRHGGASRDHLRKLRTIAEIQRRGRWASDQSMRIYDKPGRMQQAVNLWGNTYEKLGGTMQLHFDTYYQNGLNTLPRALLRQLNEICKGTGS